MNVPLVMSGGIAFGQVHDRIDFRRLALESGAQHELMLGGGAVDEQPYAAADAARLRPRDDALLRTHQPGTAPRLSAAGTSSVSAYADVPSSCE